MQGSAIPGRRQPELLRIYSSVACDVLLVWRPQEAVMRSGEYPTPWGGEVYLVLNSEWNCSRVPWSALQCHSRRLTEPCVWQARRPAFQREFGNDQHPVRAPRDAFGLHGLLPGREALAGPWVRPARGSVGIEPSSQSGHGGPAHVPIDQPVNLRQPLPVASLDFTHRARGVEARVQVRQERRLRGPNRQALGNRDNTLGLDFGLQGRELQIRGDPGCSR